VKQPETTLRIAFMVGAVTDALAIVPMIIRPLARLMWGIEDSSGAYQFAMGYAASLMLGWTVLLVWAYRQPVERRFVAVITILVICGLILAEIVAVPLGAIPWLRMAPTWCIQIVLLILFGNAFWIGRKVDS
jgi:hypothetical protein